PRMKQLYDFARERINRGKIRAFEVITVPAGERDIFCNRFASMLGCCNVVRFVRKDSIIFVKEAILAAVAGAAPNERPKISRYTWLPHEGGFDCRRTRDLSSMKKRFSRAMLSSSRCSSRFSEPARFFSNNSRPRAPDIPDGRNVIIS